MMEKLEDRKKSIKISVEALNWDLNDGMKFSWDKNEVAYDVEQDFVTQKQNFEDVVLTIKKLAKNWLSGRKKSEAKNSQSSRLTVQLSRKLCWNLSFSGTREVLLRMQRRISPDASVKPTVALFSWMK